MAPLHVRCRSLTICLIVAVVAACSKGSETVETIVSPSREVTLTVRKSDLGACCSNRLLISAKVFGTTVDDLADIRGSSDIRYEWSDPDTLSIIACNASEASYRSDFTNRDYTKRFIVSVRNVRPNEDGDRVVCSTPQFRRLTEL